MKISKTGVGATVEEATKNALELLSAPAGAKVETNIIDRGKAKILGIFGGSPAKVEASYEQIEKKAKIDKTEKNIKTAPAVKPEPSNEKSDETRAQPNVDDPKFDDVKAYINTILTALKLDGSTITVTEENGDVDIDIQFDNDDYGCIIGRRGETLDAIQYLVRRKLNRNREDYNRVSINVGDYRQKREAILRSLAKRNAERVKKYGRNVVLDPMNPYERRIVHTAIQEIEGVSSHSVGSDDNRKVVITLNEGVKPTHGGYSRSRSSSSRGGSGRRSSRSAAVDASAPSRAPRSDSEGTSLYGKISF
ncbi:MAG: protein jag [Clostridiales bacterium]|nr:protein jag [Clostridiales bacterium]